MKLKEWVNNLEINGVIKLTVNFNNNKSLIFLMISTQLIEVTNN